MEVNITNVSNDDIHFDIKIILTSRGCGYHRSRTQNGCQHEVRPQVFSTATTSSPWSCICTVWDEVFAGGEAMNFLHSEVTAGSDNVVVVTLDARANVLLMDHSNFSAYCAGRSYRYRGGRATASPVRAGSPVPRPVACRHRSGRLCGGTVRPGSAWCRVPAHCSGERFEVDSRVSENREVLCPRSE